MSKVKTAVSRLRRRVVRQQDAARVIVAVLEQSGERAALHLRRARKHLSKAAGYVVIAERELEDIDQVDLRNFLEILGRPIDE